MTSQSQTGTSRLGLCSPAIVDVKEESDVDREVFSEKSVELDGRKVSGGESHRG